MATFINEQKGKIVLISKKGLKYKGRDVVIYNGVIDIIDMITPDYLVLLNHGLLYKSEINSLRILAIQFESEIIPLSKGYWEIVLKNDLIGEEIDCEIHYWVEKWNKLKKEKKSYRVSKETYESRQRLFNILSLFFSTNILKLVPSLFLTETFSQLVSLKETVLITKGIKFRKMFHNWSDDFGSTVNYLTVE